MLDTEPEIDRAPQQPPSSAGFRVRLRSSNGRTAELITRRWLAQLLRPTRPATDDEPSLARATSRSSFGPTAPPHAPYSPKQAADAIGASTMKPTPAQEALP